MIPTTQGRVWNKASGCTKFPLMKWQGRCKTRISGFSCFPPFVLGVRNHDTRTTTQGGVALSSELDRLAVTLHLLWPPDQVVLHQCDGCLQARWLVAANPPCSPRVAPPKTFPEPSGTWCVVSLISEWCEINLYTCRHGVVWRPWHCANTALGLF